VALLCDDVALQPLLPQFLVANDHTVLKRGMRNILAQLTHQYNCRGKHEGKAASITCYPNDTHIHAQRVLQELAAASRVIIAVTTFPRPRWPSVRGRLGLRQIKQRGRAALRGTGPVRQAMQAKIPSHCPGIKI